jgi:hypothetical protein
MTSTPDETLQEMIRLLDAMTPREALGVVVNHISRRVVFGTRAADAWLDSRFGFAPLTDLVTNNVAGDVWADEDGDGADDDEDVPG